MRHVTVLLLTVLLIACGGAGPPADDAGEEAPSSEAPPATAGAGFQVSFSGAQEGAISGPGVYNCLDGGQYGLADRIIISSDEYGTVDRVLLFELPTDAVTGTHELTGQGDPDSELGVDYRMSLQIDADSLGAGNYDERVDGELILDALPAEPGDPVRGSFTLAAIDSDGKEITAEGEFDFASPDSEIHFCDGDGEE